MRPTRLFSAIALVIILVTPGNTFSQEKGPVQKGATPISTANLKTEMRKLWEDHIMWTRNVIFCLVDGLPGKEQAVTRLFQNQVDIGDALKPYYGEEAGNKLTVLLKEHITISAEVVNAAKEENTIALAEANKKWYANSDEISEFLCKANPNWMLVDLKTMMHNHLELTTDEAVQRIKKDYKADIIAYDKLHVEILQMADMLANGIKKQFAPKTKKTHSTLATK
jgi:hypothetical protein